MLAALITACDGTAPTAPVAPAFTATGGGWYVLNTQMRGVPQADGTVSAAYGHVQLKLRDDEFGEFIVEWKGKLFNPANETFGSALVGPHPDPQIPPDPIVPLLTFFEDVAMDCDVVVFESAGTPAGAFLSPEQAHALLANPEGFAVMVIPPDPVLPPDPILPAVRGFFGAATPETPEDGTAPTNGGRLVRCEA